MNPINQKIRFFEYKYKSILKKLLLLIFGVAIFTNNYSQDTNLLIFAGDTACESCIKKESYIVSTTLYYPEQKVHQVDIDGDGIQDITFRGEYLGGNNRQFSEIVNIKNKDTEIAFSHTYEVENIDYWDNIITKIKCNLYDDSAISICKKYTYIDNTEIDCNDSQEEQINLCEKYISVSQSIMYYNIDEIDTRIWANVFNVNDTINTFSKWICENAIYYYFNASDGSATHLTCKSKDLGNIIGFRKIVEKDTIYGWWTNSDREHFYVNKVVEKTTNLNTTKEITTPIKVFPSPVKDILNVNIGTSKENDLSFLLFNSYGQIIKKGIILNKNSSINISELAIGVYIFEIFDSSGRSIFVKKIIKI